MKAAGDRSCNAPDTKPLRRAAQLKRFRASVGDGKAANSRFFAPGIPYIPSASAVSSAERVKQRLLKSLAERGKLKARS